MNDLYRDPLVHVHARIAELRGRVSTLSAELAQVPQFWEHHAAEKASADELFAKLPAAPAQEGSAEAILEEEHVLTSLVALLESLAAMVPDHETMLSQVPHGHPPAQPYVPSASLTLFLGDKTTEVEFMMAKLTRTMRIVDEHAEVSAAGVIDDARIVKVTGKSAGIPFTYTGALLARAGLYPVLGSHFAMYVRRDAAPLEVRPKGMLTDLMRALHITEIVHTGDAEFDQLFALTADASSSLTLSLAARAALVDLAKTEVPTLVVEPGIARLFFSFELATPTFEGVARTALRCLREIRRAARPST
jgi:hypothetical protein